MRIQSTWRAGLGGLLLFDVPDFLRVSWWVLGTVGACTLGFFALVLTAAMRARRAQPQTGRESVVGMRAVVVRPLDPIGTVRLQGELWRAVLESAEAEAEPQVQGSGGRQVAESEFSAGETVVVVGLDGLTLRVRREQDEGGFR